MLDEPSLGLAPLLVKEIFRNVQIINREMNTTILVVEQNARIALEISDYAYIMESGKIVLEGPSKELQNNPDVKEFYMGLTRGGGRKSFKEWVTVALSCLMRRKISFFMFNPLGGKVLDGIL